MPIVFGRKTREYEKNPQQLQQNIKDSLDGRLVGRNVLFLLED